MMIEIVRENMHRTTDCAITAAFGVLTFVCLWFLHLEDDLTLAKFMWGLGTLVCDFMCGFGAFMLCMDIRSKRRPRPGGGIPHPKQSTPQTAGSSSFAGRGTQLPIIHHRSSLNFSSSYRSPPAAF